MSRADWGWRAGERRRTIDFMRLSRLGASWAASVVFHAAMMGGLGWIVAAHALADRPAPAPVIFEPEPVVENGLVNIDLPPAFDGTLVELAETNPDGIPPTPAGGETTPRIDTNPAGTGGGPALDPATHLADRDESGTLTPDLLRRVGRRQIRQP